jgi:hypothetical protein
MILSIISDKKDRLLLTERYTPIKMEKTIWQNWLKQTKERFKKLW